MRRKTALIEAIDEADLLIASCIDVMRNPDRRLRWLDPEVRIATVVAFLSKSASEHAAFIAAARAIDRLCEELLKADQYPQPSVDRWLPVRDVTAEQRTIFQDQVYIAGGIIDGATRSFRKWTADHPGDALMPIMNTASAFVTMLGCTDPQLVAVVVARLIAQVSQGSESE